MGVVSCPAFKPKERNCSGKGSFYGVQGGTSRFLRIMCWSIYPERKTCHMFSSPGSVVL